MGPAYRVLLHRDTYARSQGYLDSLRRGTTAGGHLRAVLDHTSLASLAVDSFLELLVATKRAQIFAESAVYGNGSDWSATELSILGDIVVAVPTVAYDNGLHERPAVHLEPLPVTLLFVPGALLRNGMGQIPADLTEVTRDGQVDPDGYFRLYERRLLPALAHANATAAARGRRALVTIPGLGCGQFAGKFRGQLGAELDRALRTILQRHGTKLDRIAAVYYDPYNECQNDRGVIHHTHYMVRPLLHGNQNKPQLCACTAYAEDSDDFTDCDLFSVVAWDHVSWPGNDFYGGARMTDDGVKAAATGSMSAMTGVEGRYDQGITAFLPPEPFRTWGEVVARRQLRIVVAGNLTIYP